MTQRGDHARTHEKLLQSSQDLLLGRIFDSDFTTGVISRFARDPRKSEIGEVPV